MSSSYHPVQPLHAFELPNEFGWVMLVAALTFFLNLFQILAIARLRRKHSIDYPKMISEEHEDFNCAQRAHQNTLESTNFFLVHLVFAGLIYPVYAATFGLAWIVGRLFYSIGYYTGKPVWRLPGFYISLLLGMLPLMAFTYMSLTSIVVWD